MIRFLEEKLLMMSKISILFLATSISAYISKYGSINNVREKMFRLSIIPPEFDSNRKLEIPMRLKQNKTKRKLYKVPGYIKREVDPLKAGI